MYAALILVALLGAARAQELVCGTTPIAPNVGQFDRIIGGTQARPNSWPWQIAFCRNSNGNCQLICGGSVIDNNWIVTAAHCCSGQVSSNLMIRAGAHQYSNNSDPNIRDVGVRNYTMHPNYNANTLVNDICIVQLNSPLEYNNHVQPVCLARTDDWMVQPENTAYNTGWGTTAAGGSVSPVLMQVAVPFVRFDECSRNYSGIATVNQQSMICAGSPNKGSCNGDSGGPLVYLAGNRWVLAGSVSWGLRNCAQAGYPTVYVRMASYCNFIQQVTGIQSPCQF